MNDSKSGIFIADTALYLNHNEVDGEFVVLNGEKYYKIGNFDLLPPFFINIVSSSDHWMFISSTGGITAGRVDADCALFPYYTVDKITENHESVGHKTIIQLEQADKRLMWEPFSPVNVYRCERNLFKSIYCDEIIFQEINHDLNLSFRYSWKTSEQYGFVLKADLKYFGEESISAGVLSGIQNILPWGAGADMQRRLSNLLDAYKLSELDRESELGIFGFSAKISDLAEPSESLKATTVWQYGIDDSEILLSSRQIGNFRYSGSVAQEERVQGDRGAFMVSGNLNLKAGEQKSWMITADVKQDHTSVVSLRNQLLGNREELYRLVLRDCDQGTEKLKKIICGTDGLQMSNDELSSVHHFANSLYNTMRGGTFYNNYRISKSGFVAYLYANKKNAPELYSAFAGELPEYLSLSELFSLAEKYESPDLSRICRQYLPLYFSRRHGDPSRPWNKFSIRLKDADGSDRLDYEGNWRDIFQNWEALALSYPEYIESMIFRFLNATTADGYNPYRIHLSGVDWEKPDPNDPWSNIGYWSDHQIIYLQKLLELSLKFHPEFLHRLLNRGIFTHTNVPYRIKSYSSVLKDPHETIEFDQQEDRKIEKRVEESGADGQLLMREDGTIVHVSMMEKLIILLLAKLSNIIPGGGLWMNTQRPEWNDANNALAGKGLSVVSVCYMRRFISFLTGLAECGLNAEFELTEETWSWLNAVSSVMSEHHGFLSASFDKPALKSFMDGAGRAADNYRRKLYRQSPGNETRRIGRDELGSFFRLALEYVDHCIRNNKRDDGLYHSYNILSYDDGGAEVSNLYEMLEGQVAVLSSGLLKPAESLQVITSLRRSRMYRKDQNSYMLYPERSFPGFLERNTFSKEDADGIELLTALEEARNTSLVSADENGDYHFNGSFHNVKDLRSALAELRKDDFFRPLVKRDALKLEELFMRTFNHHEFTGRSGTFFGYEGLGSIYWHMVSKLLLAAQEAAVHAFESGESRKITSELIDAYYDIRNGLGFNKSPAVYGAFPTDPYSHTPAGKGAKQPGMTGQVKEEILTRLTEMGFVIDNGEICFLPLFLRDEEFVAGPADFVYYDISGAERTISFTGKALILTFCQVPIVIKPSDADRISIEAEGGLVRTIPGSVIPAESSSSIFRRSGGIIKVTVETTKAGGAIS